MSYGNPSHFQKLIKNHLSERVCGEPEELEVGALPFGANEASDVENWGGWDEAQIPEAVKGMGAQEEGDKINLPCDSRSGHQPADTSLSVGPRFS